MRRHRSILILAFCCLLAAVAFAQTPTPFPADVISVSVIVADASNRAITGLALKDFRVLEDQVEQTILSVKENKAAGDYTLSFAPKNTVKDGTFRRIRVDIPVLPGLRVLHSTGYYARPETQ
jgi:hypothetical protein